MNSRAGAGQRLAAFAIDYLLISAYAIALAIVTVSLFSSARPSTNPWRFDLVAFGTLVLPVILYFALTEASGHRATLGKRRLGLLVADVDGGRLRLGRSVLRSTIKFLPWQIAHTSLFHIPGWPMDVETIPVPAMTGLVISHVLAAVFVIGLFMPSRRTLYDRVAGAYVTTR